MHIGYNTNGFAAHALHDAMAAIAGLGYRALGLTLDRRALNPYGDTFVSELAVTEELIAGYGMAVVVETGARFLLDGERKHYPTLLEKDPRARAKRIDFLKRAADIAARFAPKVLSFWSGKLPDGVPADAAYARLVEGASEVAEYAGARGVTVAFEPEPGMLVDTLEKYECLKGDVKEDNFLLTADVGHFICTEASPPEECIRRCAADIRNVHLEDMKRGRHEHLFFGEGELDLKKVLCALRDTGYDGCVNVELSRHSDRAVETARKAKELIDAVLGELGDA